MCHIYDHFLGGMIATSDQDVTFDVMAKLKTPMGMPISKTTKVVTNFKTPEVLCRSNDKWCGTFPYHLLCNYVTTPKCTCWWRFPLQWTWRPWILRPNFGQRKHANPIKSNMHFYKFFQCTFPLVIASDSKNIPSITKLVEVAKPSLVPTSVFRLPREVWLFF